MLSVGDNMTGLVELLASFNRKERFFLVGTALGNPRFCPSDAFRHQLVTLFDLSIPKDAFVAMDYHLDWMHAALTLAFGASEDGVHVNDGNITGNQEDVDLLFAFDAGEMTHLLLLEAKAETGWTNKQMHSKARRFAGIFGEDGHRYPLVTPHLALVSPRPPQQIESERWPAWMTRAGKPLWLELPVPGGLRRVERCDATGHASAEGSYFRVLRKRQRSVEEVEP
ncbi:MAG: hypothetical protein A2341_04680 [Deltaproteobacteria bacterium RIFOXYB12_FULL_58_9]|nr:MAG: hypothetical protein A2341_04680 [Deltaproteobacteria bacterium RIFOXYB12_FULL_58_9]